MRTPHRVATIALATALLVPAGVATAQPASAAPVVTTAAVQVETGHRYTKDRDDWIFGLKKPRVYVCQIAPALCKGR